MRFPLQVEKNKIYRNGSSIIQMLALKLNVWYEHWLQHKMTTLTLIKLPRI